jgi:hypothetical protein
MQMPGSAAVQHLVTRYKPLTFARSSSMPISFMDGDMVDFITLDFILRFCSKPGPITAKQPKLLRGGPLHFWARPGSRERRSISRRRFENSDVAAGGRVDGIPITRAQE